MKRSTKSLLATLVVFLSLATPVWAGPFEDGRAAYNSGDYATALRLWLLKVVSAQVPSMTFIRWSVLGMAGACF